jgi:hypothetical protein
MESLVVHATRPYTGPVNVGVQQQQLMGQLACYLQLLRRPASTGYWCVHLFRRWSCYCRVERYRLMVGFNEHNV